MLCRNAGVDPVSAGIFDFRTVISYETALAKIGAENLRPEQPLQTIYAGNRMLMFFDYINDGKDIAILGAGLAPDDWNDGTQWKKKVSRNWLLDRYRSWPAFAKEMAQVRSWTALMFCV